MNRRCPWTRNLLTRFQVQALLLICVFQQNHQRSVASWTYHAIAVKAAYQLGLQSPSSYQDLHIPEKEVRKRLWYGIINQDRYSSFSWEPFILLLTAYRCLSISLGRPCLIAPEHIRIEKPDFGQQWDRLTFLDHQSQMQCCAYLNHLM